MSLMGRCMKRNVLFAMWTLSVPMCTLPVHAHARVILDESFCEATLAGSLTARHEQLIDLLAEKARSIDGPVSVLLSARALNVDNNVGVRLARTLTAALSRLN
jgi:hypothetical protein